MPSGPPQPVTVRVPPTQDAAEAKTTSGLEAGPLSLTAELPRLPSLNVELDWRESAPMETDRPLAARVPPAKTTWPEAGRALSTPSWSVPAANVVPPE